MLVPSFQALGGLGLFLLGMILMTDGLRDLAGAALNRTLYRFTRSPLSGAITGAGLTAVVQSSSATTVAVVGFVSAELLTFPQALGVLFGANIGTTATGWLVTLFGFELEVGQAMKPLLLLGVLLRLFGRKKVRSAGWALVGFAVLFLGLEQMSHGLEAFGSAVTPSDFPPDTWGGRLLLVLIGIVVTLVTQSSSAGVAIALTALTAGTISFPQAAAMVIGMDVGTTSTTAIATIGGSAQTRRTGYSHVVYNLMTGVIALVLLEPYLRLLDGLGASDASTSSAVALVGFHTTFNAVGVLLVLPFTGAFARLMQRIVPEDDVSLTRRLDPSLLADGAAASLALLAAVREITREVFRVLEAALTSGARLRAEAPVLRTVDRAVVEARAYAGSVRATPADREAYERLLAAMHCLDHLERLSERCAMEERIRTTLGEERLRALAEDFRGEIREASASLAVEGAAPVAARLGRVRTALRRQRRPYRATVLEDVPTRGLDIDEAIRRLDAIRWLHRASYHAWRIVYHLERAPGPARPQTVSSVPRRAEAVLGED